MVHIAAVVVLVRLIKVVALEQLLRRRVHQVDLVLFHSLRVLPLLIVDVILVEVYVVSVRNVRRSHAALAQSLPIEVSEPSMSLGLSIAIVTQAMICLAS